MRVKNGGICDTIIVIGTWERKRISLGLYYKDGSLPNPEERLRLVAALIIYPTIMPAPMPSKKLVFMCCTLLINAFLVLKPTYCSMTQHLTTISPFDLPGCVCLILFTRVSAFLFPFHKRLEPTSHQCLYYSNKQIQLYRKNVYFALLQCMILLNL
jgi:hypothetical protein